MSGFFFKEIMPLQYSHPISPRTSKSWSLKGLLCHGCTYSYPLNFPTLKRTNQLLFPPVLLSIPATGHVRADVDSTINSNPLTLAEFPVLFNYCFLIDLKLTLTFSHSVTVIILKPKISASLPPANDFSFFPFVDG